MNIKILIIAAGIVTNITATGAPAVAAKDIIPERELLITKKEVIESEHARYPGVWSFGTLIEELAGKDKAAAVVREWLETMAAPEMVLQQRVEPRPRFRELVLEPWQKKDGYDANSCDAWVPRLENAPFRLLAIVNRMDLAAPTIAKIEEQEHQRWKASGWGDLFEQLRSAASSGELLKLRPPVIRTSGVPIRIGLCGMAMQGFGLPVVTNAGTRNRRVAAGFGGGWAGGGGGSGPFVGEGRLVFCATDSAGVPLPGGWTVIFEYRLPVLALQVLPAGVKASDNSDRNLAAVWAGRWHALANNDVDEKKFRDGLAEVTTSFTHRRIGGGQPELAQLRSNDGACGPGREFRQFEIKDGRFVSVGLPGTPAVEFMNPRNKHVRELAAFLNQQTPLLTAGLGGLPEKLAVRGDAIPLRAAVAVIPEKKEDFFWDFGPVVPADTRRLLSMNSCNGCHAGETGCEGGMHIRPRTEGSESALSTWLREDMAHRDPAMKNASVHFKEMEDRRAILAALLNPKEARVLADIRETLRKRLRRGH